MQDLPHLPYSITAPMASMNGHMNACPWYLNKEIRTNPNLDLLKVNQQPTCEIETQNYIQIHGGSK